MFGNRPLPNIAPSLILFLPPPPDAFPTPPPLPPASRAPTWAKRGRAHRRRRCLPTTPTPRHPQCHSPCAASPPCHHGPQPTRPVCHRPQCRHVTSNNTRRRTPYATSAAPPLIKGCGRTTSTTSPPTHLSRPPSNATSPTANDIRPCPRHTTQAPAGERHVTKTEGAKRAETGVGGGKRRGKEAKGKLRVGRRAFVPPPSCSVVSAASEMVCTPHTGSFGLPDANERCAIPHTAPFELFYPPLSFGGGNSFLQRQERGSMKSTCRLVQAGLFPPMGGFSFLQHRRRGRRDIHAPPPTSLRLSPPLLGEILHIASAAGAVWYPHAVPLLLGLPPWWGVF